jgi:hypothetical protein
MKNSFIKVRRKGLRSLRHILEKWVEVHTTYSKREDWEDSIWWCHERPNVGALAAAVWISGGTALEEYSTLKLHKGRKRAGRCDLFFRTKGGKAYACEAKQLWFTGGMTQKQSSEAVNDYFNAAQDDAKKLHPTEGRKLAICFVTLDLPPKTNNLASIKKSIAKLIEVLTSTNADAMAWCFPPKARLLLWEKNHRRYPGVAVLIRKVVSSKI